jgi:predicted ATPase
MTQEHHITFGPFRLETTQARLWRGEQIIPLRPRTGAVLQYLATHPGRLVTKTELLQHVWSGTHVTDTVLRVCIREIRTALEDAVEAPQYLQTVGRQGYQWLVLRDSTAVPPAVTRPIVGRQAEVEALEKCFMRAATGERQLVFLSGEGGIGKSTVIDLWLAHLDIGSAVWLGRGQCAEHYGAGEPYLPVLEALGQLGRGPAGPALLAVLRRYAPMWLVQLPGLVSDAELERVQRQVQGATQARMIRELAEALDVLTTDTPLVLVLEDLHWSDIATVEFLAYLAQRREPVRLLVLGTYRPVETVLQAHPLRGIVQELCGRSQGVDLRLEFLPAKDVAAYVAGRLGGPVAAPLVAFIYERTNGNALFMVSMVEYLFVQGEVVRHTGEWMLREGAEDKGVSIPDGLRQLLARRIETLLPETRRVLEVASVVGREFAVAAVAAGLQCPVEDIEARCEALAIQHHFIDDIGLAVWPDGTRGGSYRFQHALYQQALYEQIGTARRGQCHRHIGLRLEAGYGARVREIAAQLAVHFESGGETLRAVHHWQQTGDNAARRNAYHEAIAALRHGLTLLATLPDSPERTQYALALQITLGELCMATQGMASPEAGAAYRLAHALCQGLEGTLQHFQVLRGLCRLHRSQAKLRAAEALSQQLFDVAQCLHDAVLVLESHMAIGNVAFYLGDLATARVHLEQSLGLWDTPPLPTTSFSNGYESSVMHGFCYAMVLWLLGYADQAQQWGQETLTLAQQLEHPPSLAYAQLFGALLAQFRRDAAAIQAHTNILMTATTAQDFAFRIGQGHLLQGWALAMQEDADAGIALICQGFTMTEGVGLKLYRPYFLALLAEAYGQAGQPEAGLAVLDEALTFVATTEERWWEVEVWRLKGELLLRLPLPDIRQATACLHHALAVAHRQQAKTLELRAALSLSRLWQQQGQRDQARQLLTEIYGWFTEGFETPDLQEARRWLDAR